MTGGSARQPVNQRLDCHQARFGLFLGPRQQPADPSLAPAAPGPGAAEAAYFFDGTSARADRLADGSVANLMAVTDQQVNLQKRLKGY